MTRSGMTAQPLGDLPKRLPLGDPAPGGQRHRQGPTGDGQARGRGLRQFRAERGQSGPHGTTTGNHTRFASSLRCSQEHAAVPRGATRRGLPTAPKHVRVLIPGRGDITLLGPRSSADGTTERPWDGARSLGTSGPYRSGGRRPRQRRRRPQRRPGSHGRQRLRKGSAARPPQRDLETTNPSSFKLPSPRRLSERPQQRCTTRAERYVRPRAESCEARPPPTEPDYHACF